MSDYTPIDCHLHDHIEIACMHRYRLRIRTTDGRIVVGTASYTRTDEDKIEYLLLADGAQTDSLRLDEIVQIEPLSQDASFGAVRFK